MIRKKKKDEISKLKEKISLNSEQQMNFFLKQTLCKYPI